MSEKDINLVLIVSDEKNKAFYQNHLAAYDGIKLEVYPNFIDFRNQSEGKLYSGFLVDIRTLIKSSSGEKLLFSHLLQHFPVMRVTKKPGSDSFSGLLESKSLGRLKGQALLDAFINDLCCKIQPRDIPTGKQKGIFRSAYLYYSEDFKQEPEKAVIENLTVKSCYVVTNEACAKGDHLWLLPTELNKQTPIRCEINWVKPWTPGSLYLPGCGVSFINLMDEQIEQLSQLLKD
ncbi:hypothetical protein JY97_07035 [Alkalispirochaeta odontotermitis]|nr:hypothetical protein JY97_07035 [Alkalispirochaeta odontotermitis]CAB1080234.1 hypothetical protein D1AOALGA4SA_7921 [Olavius algarvensis Delta 1 endosymbiont]